MSEALWLPGQYRLLATKRPRAHLEFMTISLSLRRGREDVVAGEVINSREETVVLTPAEGPEVSKDVLKCEGFPYDSINEWTRRFAAYFP